nr:condensation domain-containing protein [Bacillus subtilis]WGD74589.1 condensation domain-containing protein [Bacillus subtilis]
MAFSLDAGKADALRRLAKETDSTLYMVLLASYSAFLSKLSGQDDIIVGSPVVRTNSSGRQPRHRNVRQYIGAAHVSEG